MNIFKNVVNRIAESDRRTQLASQKVELALVDDLNKALQDSDAIVKGIKDDDKRIEDMQKAIDKLQKERSKLGANYDKLDEQFFEAQRKLEEIENKRKQADQALENNTNNINQRSAEIEKSEKSKAPKVKKAQSILGVFDKNLAKAEAAARDLGIKLPIAKYKKAQDNLRKSIS